MALKVQLHLSVDVTCPVLSFYVSVMFRVNPAITTAAASHRQMCTGRAMIQEGKKEMKHQKMCRKEPLNMTLHVE